MSVFSYVVEHDLGFAPNPFHRVCSLACCKPRIRKVAEEGDYIFGTGASRPNLRGHLIYWMRVDEILTFDQYWSDPRFRRKKPVTAGSTYQRYGDNIYHRHTDGTFLQVDSFHSLEDGSPSRGDIRRDTGATDRVLLSRNFAYWGRAAVKLPPELKWLPQKGQGHKRNFSNAQVERLMAWIKTSPRGYLGEPADWQFLSKPRRRTRGKKKS